MIKYERFNKHALIYGPLNSNTKFTKNNCTIAIRNKIQIYLKNYQNF